MAFGVASTKENSAQKRPKENSNKPKWFKKKKDVWNDTHTNSGAKVECFVCKGEHVLTSCETWKKLAVNEQWELPKRLGLCFCCLQRGHRIERCSLERNMSSQRVCVKTPPTNSCSPNAGTVKSSGWGIPSLASSCWRHISNQYTN